MHLLYDLLRHEASPCYLLENAPCSHLQGIVPPLLQIFTALSSISLSVSALQGRDDRALSISHPCLLSPLNADVQSQGLRTACKVIMPETRHQVAIDRSMWLQREAQLLSRAPCSNTWTW